MFANKRDQGTTPGPSSPFTRFVRHRVSSVVPCYPDLCCISHAGGVEFIRLWSIVTEILDLHQVIWLFVSNDPWIKQKNAITTVWFDFSENPLCLCPLILSWSWSDDGRTNRRDLGAKDHISGAVLVKWRLVPKHVGSCPLTALRGRCACLPEWDLKESCELWPHGVATFLCSFLPLICSTKKNYIDRVYSFCFDFFIVSDFLDAQFLLYMYAVHLDS